MSNADHETPPEPSSPETRFARFRRWAWRRKIIVRTVLGTLLAYVVLFTFVWSVLVELVLAGAYFTVHLGVADEDLPAFRPYIQKQPAFRAVCDFGHWVADITQPLVSDAVLIAHWEKHHKEWESLLDKKPVNAQPEDYRRFEAYVKSVGLAWINYDRSDHPERFATMEPPPELGAANRKRPCVGRGGSGKAYRYFPETPLVIVGNQVMQPSTLKFAQDNHFEPDGDLLVPSTDQPRYTWVARRLTPHWFIKRRE